MYYYHATLDWVPVAMVSHVLDYVCLCVLNAFLMQSNQSLLNALMIRNGLSMLISLVMCRGHLPYYIFDLRDICSYVVFTFEGTRGSNVTL